jgi:spermidine synthase
MPVLFSSGAFSLALFVSAALLFAVQPMLGRMLLPLVGGAPSGWLTALAFFQIALLVGYAIAHLLARFDARRQMFGTILLITAGTLFLPPHLTQSASNGAIGAGGVVALLFQAVALPYIALSTVSSGLQRLFAARTYGQNQDPYFLYAASNAGSFAGLLAYPFVLEPFLKLSEQAWLWGIVYGFLLILLVLLTSPRLATNASEASGSVPKPALPDAATKISTQQKCLWVLLAFIPSSLSMGLTSLLTKDLGSVPLLWVIPLGLYLLTFVLAFARKRRVNMNFLRFLQLISTGILIALFATANNLAIANWGMTLPPILAFFVTALWCHTRLAELRPNEAKLTEYYLWLSLGGALGGSFNAFLVPLILAMPHEFIIMLLLALFLQPSPKITRDRTLGLIGAALLVILCVTTMQYNIDVLTLMLRLFKFLGIVIAVALACYLPRALSGAGLAVIILGMTPLNADQPLAVARDFFGSIRVVDSPLKEDPSIVWRRFIHGSTIHGMQKIAPSLSTQVNSYYTTLLLAARYLQSRDIGILGLGAGVQLCMQKPAQNFTVYEISPLAVTIAKQWFSFIRDCGEPTWRIGDGRLLLAQDKDARFDLLVMDAFSSDAIPMHLLTREAVAIYKSRLKPNGVIAFNISNRYYDLLRPLAALAEDAELSAYYIYDGISDLRTGKVAAKWVLMAPKTLDLTALEAEGWKPLSNDNFNLWTDDYANVFEVMNMVVKLRQSLFGSPATATP